MITVTLIEKERTVFLSATEDTLVQGVFSFENLGPVRIRWSTIPFSETNLGGRQGSERGVSFSTPRDIYFKKTNPPSSVQCRSIAL